tara:strand:+ start:194 stop:448 length:255 start_codon:yes stop_codon:yes gene_type:complete
MALYHPKFEANCLYAKEQETLLYIKYQPSCHDCQSAIKTKEDVKILIEHPLQIESSLPKDWIKDDADVHEMLAIFHRYLKELER